MSVVLHKDESRTLIIGAYEKYDINQSPDKGITLYIGPERPERLSNEPKISLSIPAGSKTLDVEKNKEKNIPEIVIWPVPLNVLIDIQERTNGNIRVEDVAEYSKETKPGEEFFIRIKGYVLMTTNE
jgi:hypothetical protein